MARVSSSAAPTNKKQNVNINDFSGGINSLTSGTKFDLERQGIEFLNFDFELEGKAQKRPGFQKVKLCEGADPLVKTGYKVEIVGQFNQLLQYNNDKHSSGYKIRPWEFIVIQRTPQAPTASSKITRHLMVYDVANKTYVQAKYKPFDSRGMSSFKFLDIDWSYPYDSPTITWNYELSMEFPTLYYASTLNDVMWEYNYGYDNLAKKDFAFIAVDSTFYFRAGSNQFAENKDYFYITRDKDAVFTDFKQVQPRKTTPSEEKLSGWDILYGMPYYIQNAGSARSNYKTAMGWGNKNKSLGPFTQLLNSDIPKREPSSSSSDSPVYDVIGLRSNHPGVMPGGQIFNTASPLKPSYFNVWADWTETPNKQKTLSFEQRPTFYSKSPGQTGGKIPLPRFHQYGSSNSNYSLLGFSRLHDWLGWKKAPGGLGNSYSVPYQGKWINRVESGILPFNWIAESDETHFYAFKEPNGDEKTFEFKFKYDVDLWRANFVSMGEHPDAIIKKSELQEININNKLFHVKNYAVKVSKNKIFFSFPGKPNWFPHNFSLELPLKKADDLIQGFQLIANNIMVFSKYQIYRITGNTPSIHAAGGTPFGIELLYDAKGAIAPDSIHELNSKIYHLGVHGIHESKLSRFIADKIDATEIDENISNRFNIDPVKDANAKAIVFKGAYYIYIPSTDSIFVKGFERNGKDIRWAQWKTELSKDKIFYGFAKALNSAELFVNVGGYQYVLTKDQYYDGEPGADPNKAVGEFSGEEKLYKAHWVSAPQYANKPEAMKKFKKLKITALIPGDRGTELFVRCYAGQYKGIKVYENKELKTRIVNNKQENYYEIKESMDFNAGTTFNKDSKFDVSKWGSDTLPTKAIKFNNAQKSEALTIEVWTKNKKPFILDSLASEFRYKTVKY